jgi:hypothetical protein
VTKFTEGAWIVLLLMPMVVGVLSRIHHHYADLAARLSLEHYGETTRVLRQCVIIPLAGVHRGTLEALRYARSLSDDITAVHVSIDPTEAEAVRQKWELWGEGVRLVILESPYRLLLEPLLQYIADIAERRQPNETITIVVPQFISGRWWHNFLHHQTAIMLRLALLFRRGIIITDVPFHVE